jgi:hypothetical protein
MHAISSHDPCKRSLYKISVQGLYQISTQGLCKRSLCKISVKEHRFGRGTWFSNSDFTSTLTAGSCKVTFCDIVEIIQAAIGLGLATMLLRRVHLDNCSSTSTEYGASIKSIALELPLRLEARIGTRIASRVSQELPSILVPRLLGGTLPPDSAHRKPGPPLDATLQGSKAIRPGTAVNLPKTGLSRCHHCLGS